MVNPPSVTVTGMGLVLPTGTGLSAAEPVFAGRSAVAYLNGTTRLAGVTGASASGFVAPEGTAAHDRAVQMAAAAADDAWRGARLHEKPASPDRVAVLVSLSKGGIFALTRWARDTAAAPGATGRQATAAEPHHADGPQWADPAAAGRLLAQRYRLAGPVLSPVTACASGGHALTWAASLIRRRVVDAALVGAAEASLHPLVLGSYRRMGVLAEARTDPTTSVRPFSATRRGFAVGEGAGVLVLEAADSAARRGVRPLVRLTGWATGSHGAGMTDVEVGGAALAQLMRSALDRAGTPPGSIDYVHAHGTATRANDLAEARAIRAALGSAADTVSVSSTKASHGHLLGAATAVETVVTVLAMGRSLVPPTVNLTDPDPAIGLDCTPMRARDRPIRTAMKIAGGFGGQMVAFVLSQAMGDGA